jgi:hypothetical protein
MKLPFLSDWPEANPANRIITKIRVIVFIIVWVFIKRKLRKMVQKREGF